MKDGNVILTSEECGVILDSLCNTIGMKDMLANPLLFNVIAKLSGNFNYSAYASGDPEPIRRNTERWCVRGDGDSWINCIKAIRILTGLGLKEAKDLVESLGGRIGGFVMINTHDLGIKCNLSEAILEVKYCATIQVV